VDGCAACEQEPSLLTPYLSDARDALAELEHVSKSYEHRIDVVHGYIDELRHTIDVLHAELEGVYNSIRSLAHDIDCVEDEEPPSGYHINEIMDDEFTMPSRVACDCTVCRLDAITKRYTKE